MANKLVGSIFQKCIFEKCLFLCSASFLFPVVGGGRVSTSVDPISAISAWMMCARQNSRRLKNIQNSKSLAASEIFLGRIFGSASFFVRLSSCLFIFVWQNYIFPLTKVFLLLLWNRIKISSNTNFSFQSTLFSSPLRHTSRQRVL